MKRVGIFGGSFNPPHVGHILAVQYAQLTGRFDEILVIPTYKHPTGKSLVSFYHRIKMCQLAFGSIPNCIVDPIESILPGPSYTYRTLQALYKQRPAEYKFILGTDIDQTSWKNYKELSKISSPFWVGRLGYPKPGNPEYLSIPGVSSTHIRDLLLKFEYEQLVKIMPGSVLEYVVENKLYIGEKTMNGLEELIGGDAGGLQSLLDSIPDDDSETITVESEVAQEAADQALTDGTLLDLNSQMGSIMQKLSFDAPVSDPGEEKPEDEEETEDSNVIDSFTGKYLFLSNMYAEDQRSHISWETEDEDGETSIKSDYEEFRTLEHAFQASKTLNRDSQLQMQAAVTPKQAKRIGKRVELIDNWDYKRIDIMHRLLKDKFDQNFDLKLKLLLTGDAELIQGNSDDFWGHDKDGNGANHLGLLLMKVRKEIVDDEGTVMELVRNKLEREKLGFMADWIDEDKVKQFG